jgi:hypothetical protein
LFLFDLDLLVLDLAFDLGGFGAAYGDSVFQFAGLLVEFFEALGC